MAEWHHLRPEQLQLNEPLPWDVYDRGGQLLLRKGYVIQRNAQIERLLEIGMFVDAKTYRAYVEQQSRAAEKPYEPLVVWKTVQGALGALCSEPPKDGSFVSRIKDLARQVMELVLRCPDWALAAIQLQEFRRYPLAHSLHVAVLCEMVARRGDFDEESRLSLACAALTANADLHELQQILFFSERGFES